MPFTSVSLLFDAETLAVMRGAYDSAWAELRRKGAVSDHEAAARRRLALCILGMAQSGEPERLQAVDDVVRLYSQAS